VPDATVARGARVKFPRRCDGGGANQLDFRAYF
jgi:hypothetical protein